MRYRFTLILKFLLITYFTANASYSVRIIVRDNDKQALVGATVQIINSTDGNQLSTTTDISGVASFKAVAPSLYSVIIRSVGFKQAEAFISVNQEISYFEFNLQEDFVALGEVMVMAKRPLIRQEDDKMIIDPEPMANSSTSTLEVLEQTPGLFVDQDGGIYLNSARPASIYINGREQKMSNQDVAGILRSLPPGSVQRIEVMRTPSTKYDAASSGGIINIVLKKGVKIGRFGTVNTGMNQGYYGNRFAGISFNNSGEKTTGYINANYNHTGQLERLSLLRNLNQYQYLHQNARTKSFSDEGYLGYGIQYDHNNRLNLSYDGRINAGKRDVETLNKNTISRHNSYMESENQTTTINRTNFFSFQQDFGAVRLLDTLGSAWDNKFSFSFNNGNTDQHYSNQLYQSSNPFPGGAGTVGQSPVACSAVPLF